MEDEASNDEVSHVDDEEQQPRLHRLHRGRGCVFGVVTSDWFDPQCRCVGLCSDGQIMGPDVWFL